MNTKVCLLITLSVCIGLLPTGYSTGQVESSATLSFSGVMQQTSPTPTPTPAPTETYSYVISVSGSNYQVKNVATGQTTYQGTNAAQVISNAISSATQGDDILFKAGTYMISQSIVGHNKNGVDLYFENGATLFASNGMNVPVVSFDSCSNCNIYGMNSSVTIDGNKFNQNINLGTGIHGIVFWGSSNCVTDGVWIDNVLQFAYVSADSQNSGIINSKTTNSGWNGIQLGSASGNEVGTYAKNNEVFNCGDVGISLWGINCIAQNNNVHDILAVGLGWGDDHWGIAVEQGYGHTITGNTVDGAEYGIVVGGSGGTNIVSSNTVKNCQRNGIHVGGSTTVNDNTITDWNMWLEGQYAIYISGDGNTAKNNNATIVNTSYQHNAGGVYVNGNNNKVLLNTINVAANFNPIINVAGGTGNQILSNKLNGNTNGSSSIVVAGSTNTTIAYNDVTGVTSTVSRLSDVGSNTMVYDNIPKTLLPDKNVPAAKITPPT